MPRLFINQKTPNPQKNFFQNYKNHLNHQEVQYKHFMKELNKKGTVDEFFYFIADEAIKRATIFEKLRDGHDYFDEIMGATVVPVMAMIEAVIALGKAIWEGLQVLAIHCNFISDDDIDHKQNALTNLVYSAETIIIGALVFLNSAVSSITRLVVTAAQGFEEQDKVRFIDNDSVQSNFSPK